MFKLRRQGFVVGRWMVKNKYVAVLCYDSPCGIFFLQEFDYLFAAKGEDFRSCRLCDIPN